MAALHPELGVCLTFLLTLLDIRGNLQIEMMDYTKTRTEAEARKQLLLSRQQAIPQEKKRLDEEMEQIKRELIGIEQILDGLGFMESDVPLDFEPSGFTDSI